MPTFTLDGLEIYYAVGMLLAAVTLYVFCRRLPPTSAHACFSLVTRRLTGASNTIRKDHNVNPIKLDIYAEFQQVPHERCILACIRFGEMS